MVTIWNSIAIPGPLMFLFSPVIDHVSSGGPFGMKAGIMVSKSTLSCILVEHTKA